MPTPLDLRQAVMPGNTTTDFDFVLQNPANYYRRPAEIAAARQNLVNAEPERGGVIAALARLWRRL